MIFHTFSRTDGEEGCVLLANYGPLLNVYGFVCAYVNVCVCVSAYISPSSWHPTPIVCSLGETILCAPLAKWWYVNLTKPIRLSLPVLEVLSRELEG